MLRFNFHYSPLNEFGEYNFAYKEDVKKHSLFYKFQYSINRNQLRHKFLYDVFKSIHLEDDVVMESFSCMHLESTNIMKTFSDIGIKENVQLNHQVKSIHNDDYLVSLIPYTSMKKNIIVDNNQKFLSILSGETKRVFDLTVEEEIVKMDLMTFKTKRVFDLRVHKKDFKVTRVKKWHHANIADKQKTISTHDSRGLVINDSYNLLNNSINKEILSIKATSIEKKSSFALRIHSDLLLKTDKNISIEEDKLLKTDKNISIEEDKLLKTDKNISIEEDVLVDREKTKEIKVFKAKSQLTNDFKNITHEYETLLKLATIEKNILQDSEKKLSRYRVTDITKEDFTGLNKVSKRMSKEYMTTLTKDLKRLKVIDDKLGLNKGLKNIEITSNEVKNDKVSKFLQSEEFINLETNSVNEIESETKDEGQSLHKRLWFLQHHGKIDYKILPNTDFDYPVNLNILESPIDRGIYKYSYIAYFTEITDDYEVVAYDEDFNVIGKHKCAIDQSYQNTVDNIEIKTQIISYSSDRHQINFDISVFHENVSYFTIRQPKDIYDNFFSFVVAEEILNKSHPIPIGHDLGLKEIPIAINIMVDFINMLILMWSKFYPRFVGYQGVQAIDGFVKIVHEWVTLETSLENSAIEDYHRCYRWLRWECEKVRNKAKYDPDLSGNLWIEEVIYELVDYMEMHHFNIIPEWYNISDMDEHRNNIFTEVDFDIPIILEKVKGIRKRVVKNRKIHNKN